MTYTEKLEAAVAWLDTRWVFHLSRRVPKGNYEQQTMRCNVAETFDRVRARLGNGKTLVVIHA